MNLMLYRGEGAIEKKDATFTNAILAHVKFAAIFLGNEDFYQAL